MQDNPPAPRPEPPLPVPEPHPEPLPPPPPPAPRPGLTSSGNSSGTPVAVNADRSADWS